MTTATLDRPLRTLAAVSSAQLAANVAGQVVAVRRRLPYDLTVPPMSGRPEDVVRDSVFLGTALSAPLTMLTAQSVAIGLLSRSGRTPARVLTGLGAVMVFGYLGERVVRTRLRPSRFDAVETTVAVLGVGLAAGMVGAGTRALRGS